MKRMILLPAVVFSTYLICHGAYTEPDSVAATTVTPAGEAGDSIFHQLSEVVVEGRTQRVVKYGVEYIPDKHSKKAAADATDLLLRMQIPQLSVMAGNTQIKTVTGRDVSMFIDYHPASEQDLAGMQPDDVLRVEVLQYPQDPRFEGAAYVVNFVMQKYEWGGYTKINASGSTFSSDNLDGSVYSKFVYKKWTFDANVAGHISHNDRYRDYQHQTYRDVVFNGKSYGQLDRITRTDSYLSQNNNQWASMRAALNTENTFIEHTVSFFRNATPHERLGSVLSMPQADLDDVLSQSRTSTQGISPTARGYYYFRLPKGNTVSLSWNFGYSHTNRNSLYSVTGLSPIHNINREDTYSPTANLSYSKNLGHNNTFRTALMTFNTIYDTHYGGSYDGRQKLLSSENMLFLEYMQNWKCGLSLYSRAGMSYVIGRVNGVNILEQWNPRLGMQLQYSINDQNYASIEGWWGNSHPGASEYNNALVQSNELLWLQGNPDLKNTIFQQVTASYTYMPSNKVSLAVFGEYEGNPDKQAFEYLTMPGYDGLVRRTINSGDFRSYRGWISSTVRLFQDQLSIQAQARIERAENTGADAGHQTWVSGWAQATYYLKNFSFIANYITPGREINGFSRGSVYKYHSSYNLILAYTAGGLRLQLSASNCFSRGRLYTSADNPRLSTYGWEWSNQAAPGVKLSVTYTFRYGKKVNANNELGTKGNIDSAILK